MGKGKEPIVKTNTNNMEAYDAFIKGRYFFSSFKKGGMEKALQYYEKALTLDPKYAPAYSAIAEWYWFHSFEPSKENFYTKAREAINKALEIDNNLPEAHATLGMIRSSLEWDWKGAEESFEIALNLDPGSSKAHCDYAFYLAFVKRNSDKSIAEAKKGMIEESMKEINKGLELFPKHPQLLGLMGQIYALKGEKEKARAILNELIERSKKEYICSLFIALLYADLGELDQTFEYLNKGYEKHDICLSNIKAPVFDWHSLYTDSRFIAILKKMGLEE